jgi:hypothetical protein
MTPDEVLNLFKTKYKFSKVCKMSSSSLLNWVNKGSVPFVSQKKIELATHGLLKATWEDSYEARTKG